ncbi:MAG TPA: dienelactone hydrolase family protein [Dehalococcoidia bacterium]|nr:dienelactone hydrolase family protein [Dehalococcoidia bacterium]
MYETTTREVTFPGGGGEQQAWISTPTEPGRYPAIIMFHGRNGVNDAFKSVGMRYAEEGIAGMAVNYFTQSNSPTNVQSLETIEGAFKLLKREPSVDLSRMVMSGYCKGGGLTYLGLANEPGFAAGVVYHGGLFVQEKSKGFPESPADAALRIDVPLIILHGMSDPAVKIESVYELSRTLNELGKHVELKAYWGTRHAFTLPGGSDYVPEHADDAFREAVLFIRRTFGLPLGTVGPLGPQSAGV